MKVEDFDAASVRGGNGDTFFVGDLRLGIKGSGFSERTPGLAGLGGASSPLFGSEFGCDRADLCDFEDDEDNCTEDGDDNLTSSSVYLP